MSVSAEDIAFAVDLFAPMGAIRFRKMMGGAMLYCDDAIFGLLDSDGTVFLRAKGAFAEKLESLGSRIFSTEMGGKPSTMGYWTLPEAALDDPDIACDLARQALAASA